MNKIASLLTLTFLTLGLSACSPAEDSPEALVQCLVARTSADSAWEAGLADKRGSPAPGPAWQSILSCAGLAKTFSGLEPAVVSKYAQAVRTQDKYREGAYAALAPLSADDQQVVRTGEIGGLMERVSHVRASLANCSPELVPSIQTVASLDETFVLTVLSRYAGYADAPEARSVASALFKEVGSVQAAERPLTCSPELTSTFRQQVAAWQSFYEGAHPWAPGCRVQADADSFVVRCPS